MGEVKALRIDRLTPAPATLASAAGAVLAPRCHRATSALARAVGLLATPDLRPDEALWIERCRSVHTLGLRVAIGCAFVDADGRVLRVVDPLPAWWVAGARGARAVVECPAGVLGQVVAPGDVLRLVPPPPARRAPDLCRPRGVNRVPVVPLVPDGHAPPAPAHDRRRRDDGGSG